MDNDLDFAGLEPQSVRVKNLLGKEYVLKEPTGDAVCKWRNAVLKATKIGPGGTVSGVENLADTEPLLVSFCLFEVTRMGDGKEVEKPVPLAFVRSLNSRVVSKLFNRAKELGQLDEQETVESLEKRIEADQKRLAQLRSAKEESAADDDGSTPSSLSEVTAKNSHAGTPVGSS